jgi:hypothetical protein
LDLIVLENPDVLLRLGNSGADDPLRHDSSGKRCDSGKHPETVGVGAGGVESGGIFLEPDRRDDGGDLVVMGEAVARSS